MNLPVEILEQILGDPSLAALDLLTVAKRLSKAPTPPSMVAARASQWANLAQDVIERPAGHSTSPQGPCAADAIGSEAAACAAFESRWRMLPKPAKQALRKLAKVPGHPPAVPAQLERDLQNHGDCFDVVLAAARSHIDTTSWMAPDLFRETAIATALLAQPQPLAYPFFPNDLMHLGTKLGPRSGDLLSPLCDNDHWQLLTPKADLNDTKGRHDLFYKALGR